MRTDPAAPFITGPIKVRRHRDVLHARRSQDSWSHPGVLVEGGNIQGCTYMISNAGRYGIITSWLPFTLRVALRGQIRTSYINPRA